MHARLTTLALACAGVAVVAGPARADRIDAKLHESAPAVLAALRRADVRTVGVLRFRAERGGRPSSYDAGPINDGLAARLENVLVIHADRADPVRVVRDAGTLPTRPADRRRLFDQAHPLAWGTGRAKADAFLTGVVRCRGDMTRTTVVVEMVTAAAPDRPTTVAEFTVATDRLILADLGARFNVTARGVATARSSDLDKFAVGEARERDSDEPKPDPMPEPNPGPSGEPLTVGGVAVTMRAGSEDVAVRAGSDGPEVTCPDAARPVSFVLRNTTDKRVGVVLKLNGVSTIYEQTEDHAACRKWVLAPRAEAVVKGFHLEGRQLAPFKVAVGDDAKRMADEFGDKAGRVEVAVFAEGAVEDGRERGLTLPRRLPASRAADRQSLATLQGALMKAAGVKRTTVTEKANGRAVKREIVVADKAGAESGPALTEVDFRSPTLVEAATVRIVKP